MNVAMYKIRFATMDDAKSAVAELRVLYKDYEDRATGTYTRINNIWDAHVMGSKGRSKSLGREAEKDRDTTLTDSLKDDWKTVFGSTFWSKLPYGIREVPFVVGSEDLFVDLEDPTLGIYRMVLEEAKLLKIIRRGTEEKKVTVAKV